MPRSLALLVFLGCTHQQPPPAPLQPSPDLVAPITAAGTETAPGLDWPADVRQQPAAKTFKNVKVLGAVSSERFMAAMASMRANLGQKCALCHDVEGKNYASDDKPAKVRAREMVRMNAEINERTFEGKARVTCWTCHRGEQKPQPAAWSTELPEGFPKLSPEQLAAPAERVFKDVRQVKGMNARTFGLIMGWFARELGVKCTHCHQEGDFAADAPKKTRAREMLQMTSFVAQEFYGNDSPVGCGTCHRGSIKPPRTAADLTTPLGRAN